MAPEFCDYDRDGDLDLYLLTNRYYSPTGFPSTEPEELSAKQRKYFQFITPPLGERTLNIVPRSDRLLRNDKGKFIDVSKESGITRNPHHGLAATWWDYDKDGWPDLYVSNDFDDPDALYHNEKDGTFVDVTAQILPHTAWFSMGADSTDIDGDGLSNDIDWDDDNDGIPDDQDNDDDGDGIPDDKEAGSGSCDAKPQVRTHQYGLHT